MKAKIIITVSLFALFAAACTPAGSGLDLAPAVVSAQEWLAERLGIDLDQIVVRDFQEVEWSDSCLELGGPAESCLAAVTPGWLIVFEVDGERFEVHTNADATAIRLAGDELTPPAASSVLVGTNWVLGSFGLPGEESPELPAIAGHEPTLVFQEAGLTGGTSGCNTFGGTFVVEGDQITFSNVITTEMACLEEGVMDQEAKYYAALGTAERFELTGEGLTIWYDGGSATLNFVPLVES